VKSGGDRGEIGEGLHLVPRELLQGQQLLPVAIPSPPHLGLVVGVVGGVVVGGGGGVNVAVAVGVVGSYSSGVVAGRRGGVVEVVRGGGVPVFLRGVVAVGEVVVAGGVRPGRGLGCLRGPLTAARRERGRGVPGCLLGGLLLLRLQTRFLGLCLLLLLLCRVVPGGVVVVSEVMFALVVVVAVAVGLLLLLLLLSLNLSLLFPSAAGRAGTTETTYGTPLGTPILVDVLAQVVIVRYGVPKVSVDATPAIAMAFH